MGLPVVISSLVELELRLFLDTSAVEIGIAGVLVSMASALGACCDLALGDRGYDALVAGVRARNLL